MDDRISQYLQDKEHMSRDDRRLAEQELVFKKNNSTDSFNDTSQVDSNNDSFLDKINQRKSSEKKTPDVEKSEKFSSGRNKPEDKEKKKSPFYKKLTVVKEEPQPQHETDTISPKIIDPSPRVDEKGNTQFEFKDTELPELNAETLAAIRDQLLLQKMYESDLEKFKKFKKTQKGKKRKSRAKTRTAVTAYSRGEFIFNKYYV